MGTTSITWPFYLLITKLPRKHDVTFDDNETNVFQTFDKEIRYKELDT